MKKGFFLALLMSACAIAVAQPRYDMDTIQRERLNRGVVAIRQADGKVAVSWRILYSDKKGEPFDIYRDGRKLNDSPLTSGGTFYIDPSPSEADATYEVHGGGLDGKCVLPADAPCGYIPIKLQKPDGGFSPDGWDYDYAANDASVGDVDGDGQYEVFLKWEPTNAHDNAHDGYTAATYIDCYRLSGERLWRIDLGRNIRSGAHYTPFIVYDLDGDGRAELMVKTADGTTDGKGNVIGNADADWCDERTGRILSGPEYLSVFNGLTGEAMATVDYIPERGDLMGWGDSRGNRSERYLAGVGYFDGHRASAFFCRGYYTRTVIAAWDWDGKELKSHWTFDTNDPKWSDYAGQGNHNLRVADVDGDGCDEITYGSMAVDNDGTGLYNTGMGHGDAMHLTAFDPSTDRLQVWDCHENRRDGSDFRDAATGKVIFQIKSSTDVGRCMAADIDPTNPGVEMWSSDSHGVRNLKGEVVTRKNAPADDRREEPRPDKHTNAMFFRGGWLPTNSAVWWDGDLLREMLDHEAVSKYDYETGLCDRIVRFEGCRFNNWSKSNPCLSADIIGDWREEVLVRTDDSNELRLYVSTMPTDHRINCLMEDIPYRLGVAAENVGYNQPPETGFYLGPDKSVVDFLK